MQDRQRPANRPATPGATSGYRFSEEAMRRRQPGGPDADRFAQLTGRLPVVPKRPPTMAQRVDAPPQTPRIGRPVQVAPRRRTWRTWLFALLAVIIAIPVIWVAGNYTYNSTIPSA